MICVVFGSDQYFPSREIVVLLVVVVNVVVVDLIAVVGEPVVVYSVMDEEDLCFDFGCVVANVEEVEDDVG